MEERASLPLVSILLPVRNGWELTMDCLGSIAASESEGIDYEVVVVDDGSSDRTEALLAYLEGDVKVLRNDVPLGIEAALEQAASVAGGSYVVVLDQRVRATPRWLQELVGACHGSDENRRAVVAVPSNVVLSGRQALCALLPAGVLRSMLGDGVVPGDLMTACARRGVEVKSVPAALVLSVDAPALDQEPPALSLVVNTRNEERHLPGALASAGGVDEIVVADMASTDATVAIAEEAGARVVAVAPAGYVEPGRMVAITSASSDWIVMLDADERLAPGALDAVRSLAQWAPPEVSAFSVPFRVWIGDTRITETGWGARYERHPRVFRRDHVSWPAHVHAVPKFKGSELHLPDDGPVWIDHINFDDLEHAYAKFNTYSTIEARELLASGRTPDLLGGLRDAIDEFERRYDPDADGAVSMVMSFGLFFYRLLVQAKAVESRGWSSGPLPSAAATRRALESFWDVVHRDAIPDADPRLASQVSTELRPYRRLLATSGQVSPPGGAAPALARVSGATICDVGCGAGLYGFLMRHSWHLAGSWSEGVVAPARIVGIDFSPRALERARAHGSYDELLLADSSALPLGDGEVDTALCTENLEHLFVEEIAAAVRGLQRISRRRVVVSTPPPWKVINERWLEAEIRAATDDPVVMSYDEYLTLAGCVHKASLSPEQMHEAGFLYERDSSGAPVLAAGESVVYWGDSDSLDAAVLENVTGIAGGYPSDDHRGDWRSAYVDLLRASLAVADHL